MSWYKITFTPDEMAKGKHKQMLDVFSDLYFKTVDAQKTLAILSPKNNREKNSPYFLYIAPKNKFIAELFSIIYDATSCEKPDLSSLTVDIGDANFASHIS